MMMVPIEPQSIVVRRSEPVAAPVDGETVMLDPTQSRYFGLDRVGGRIWALLADPIRVDRLCELLREEFDVEPDRCQADVSGFLERLAEAGLLEVEGR